MRYRSDGSELSPEFWIYSDLSNPSAECDMPPAVRVTLGQWHTCTHCNITFILLTILDGSSMWVNNEEHTRMNKSNRFCREDYR